MRSFRTFLILTIGPALLQGEAALGAAFLQRVDFGQYPEHSFVGPDEWRPTTPSWGFNLVGASATMRFSDGTSAGLEAGMSIGTSGQPFGAGTAGDTITYSFNRIGINEPVAPNSFFYCQKFTNQPYYVELRSNGPLQISAIPGSKVAVWSGFVEVAAYDSIYNSTVSTKPGLAPVGSFVPFSMTYTLTDGSVWDEAAFGRQFFYTSNGTVDFTTWVVPEPSACLLACTGILPLLLKRTRSIR